MVSYNSSLSVPAAFPFDTLDHWPKWKRRFQQYHLASGLSREFEEHQVNTLLYCLGEEAKDILVSTNIGEEVGLSRLCQHNFQHNRGWKA